MQGERLGAYRIDRELGSGGMGKVYAATVEGRAPGLRTGDRVALKVVHSHLLETEGYFMRFMREAQLGASIQHVNVVRTYMCDAIVANGAQHNFLVMEYVEGQTLGELQRELDTVPEELCRHVGREICKGLAAIHGARVVHRDLKPDNVLITEDHVVKVMDLGVARLTDEAIRLSQSGAFVGSVEYAAPEQFDRGEVDGRCDLHGLGLVLYELSCGQHPYRGDSFPVVMKRVREDEPRRLGELHPQLSAFFEEVVHTLLAKSRDDRFASADELLTVLEEGEESAWWRRRALALREETKRPLRRIRIPRQTAVYGREQELALLDACFARAAEGDGQVVLIEGEAGIGKSRLVDELIVRLRQRGDDLNFLFGSYPPSGAATAAGAFSAAYREHFGEAGSAEYLRQTPILVPAFDALLMGESAPAGVELLTKDSLHTCFVNVTRSLADERVTVVLIDDLHFAPNEGRSLFTALAMAVPGQRVLLIGTARPGVESDWVAGLTRLPQTSHVGLPRLGPKDLAQLLADSFKSEQLAHSLGVQVGIKSDGNPFFAFEIIRGLREGQFIRQNDDGTWVSTQIIDEIRIPSSVLDLVNARVASLTQEERVERAHRLVRASGRHFVFDHHQVQEALYSSLPEVLREEYHAALAEALETRTNAAADDVEKLGGALCMELCEHFLRGARGASALRYLEPAQTHLTKGYLHAQVVALTERALAVPGLLTGTVRAKTLLHIAAALSRMGRRARQEECTREAELLAEEAGDDDVRARAANALGNVFSQTSRQEEAEAAYGRALAIALARGDRNIEATATGNLGVVFYTQGRLDEAREHHERRLALSRESGDRAGEAVAAGNLGGVFRAQGRLTAAHEHYERHLTLSREIGNRAGEAAATGNLGTVFRSQGHLGEARSHYERHLALSREIGDRLGEATATGNLGIVFSTQGRLVEAREHYARHLVLSGEIGSRQGEAIAQHNLGCVLWEEGENDRAKTCFAASLALSEEIGFRYLVAMTHWMVGSLHAVAREPGRARESLLAARDLAQEMGVAGVETLARCTLALLAGGDSDDALVAYAENEERLDVEDRREARYLLWCATGDPAHLQDAKRLLDEAVANVDDTTRHSMLTNRRVNREIVAAWQADSDGGPA